MVFSREFHAIVNDLNLEPIREREVNGAGTSMGMAYDISQGFLDDAVGNVECKREMCPWSTPGGDKSEKVYYQVCYTVC
jgi:hypothetical protein